MMSCQVCSCVPDCCVIIVVIAPLIGLECSPQLLLGRWMCPAIHLKCLKYCEMIESAARCALQLI